jgi:acyl-CoA synthetase (AMP-forming)/AMP-acid ligase II
MTPAHAGSQLEITRDPPTMGAALTAAAQRWPDAEALVDGARRWTFREYRTAADDVARGLIAQQVDPGDRVVIWAPNSADVAITAMAIYSIGATVVPLNTRLTGYEAAELIRRAKPRAVFTVGEFLGRNYAGVLAGHGIGGLVPLITVLAGNHEAAMSLLDFVQAGRSVPGARLSARAAAVRPGDISDIMFTSGTTGAPKGAMLRHDASTRGYAEYGRTLGLRPGDRMIGIPPFFHTFGLKGIVLTAILYGAAVLPVAVFDSGRLAGLIEREQATVLQGSPTIFLGLLDDPAVNSNRLRSLRVAGPGAMGLAPAGFARIRDEMGITQFSPGYALTESHAVGTRVFWSDDFETASTTSGRSSPDMEFRIIGDDGREVPAGTDGEILIRGYNVMSGYFEDPHGTAEAIDADGWLHTGDIGRFDTADRLIVTDRKKDMYLVGGFNTYPTEIERVLGERGDVAEVAVIGVPDARLGQVGMAFLVPSDRDRFDLADLKRFVQTRLANYKRPRYWRVVDRLPRNASGKIQKFALRDEAAASPVLPGPVPATPAGKRP